MRRRFIRQQAYALLPCALLLAAVLLTIGASLRTVRLQLNAMLVSADIQMARVSAESSMAAGEQHLRTTLKDVPDGEGSNPLAEHFASSCATPTELVSHYRLDLLWSDRKTGVCRITATGQGRMTGTQVSVQADFELGDCTSAAESAKPLISAIPPRTSDMPQHLPEICRNELRLISWRVLNEV